LLLTSITALAHERITLGPAGGRVIYLDSPTIPNAEFKVDEEGRAAITLLDTERKPLTLADHAITVTAGPRASAKKLATEKLGDGFITGKMPEGAPYTVVIQIKEKPGAKALTARLDFDPRPAKSGKPTYLDDSVNEGSGPRIAVPKAIDAHWAEIDAHHGELKENFSKKGYESLDEITQALTALLQALPAKSGAKKEAVAAQVSKVVQAIEVIAKANAARDLSSAAPALESVGKGLAELKSTIPG
jgi:hypothetical protein